MVQARSHVSSIPGMRDDGTGRESALGAKRRVDRTDIRAASRDRMPLRSTFPALARLVANLGVEAIQPSPNRQDDP